MKKTKKKKAPKAIESIAAPPFWWVEFKMGDQTHREPIAFWIRVAGPQIWAACIDEEDGLISYPAGKHEGIEVKFVFDPGYTPRRDSRDWDLPPGSRFDFN